MASPNRLLIVWPGGSARWVRLWRSRSSSRWCGFTSADAIPAGHIDPAVARRIPRSAGLLSAQWPLLGQLGDALEGRLLADSVEKLETARSSLDGDSHERCGLCSPGRFGEPGEEE